MHAARIKARAKFPLGVLTAIPSSPCVNIIGAGEWLLRRSIFAGSPTSCALPTFLFGTTSLSELLNPVGLLSPLNPVRLGNTNEVCRATGCMRNTSEVCSTPCESCSDASEKLLQARREQRPFGLPSLVRSALHDARRAHLTRKSLDCQSSVAGVIASPRKTVVVHAFKDSTQSGVEHAGA